MAKVNVYNTQGKEVGKVDLPKVFDTPVRQDLILRAVLTSQSNRRQPYATDVMAGMKTSAHYHGRRHRVRWTMMGKEMARMSRLHGKIPGYLMYRARKVPQAVKGREAHPPLIEKILEKKINKKERRLAIKSAIAATADRRMVEARGHRVKDIKEFPIVVSNDLEEIKKTADVKKLLQSFGMDDELSRIGERKVRSGKGKCRGRKYKRKIGPLFVISSQKASKAMRSLNGIDVVNVGNLSVEELAPGAAPGRLTIWSKGAIEKLK